MESLVEVALVDSAHQLGLRHEFERDVLGIVERLRANAVETARKEGVNAIGLPRGIRKQNGELRPLVSNIPGFLPQFPLGRLQRIFAFIGGAARQLTTYETGAVSILTSQKYFTARIDRHDMNPFFFLNNIEWRNHSPIRQLTFVRMQRNPLVFHKRFAALCVPVLHSSFRVARQALSRSFRFVGRAGQCEITHIKPGKNASQDRP